MAILSTEIQFFLSGGTNNTVASASLGGAISGTQVSITALNNLFDDVSGDENAAGSVKYRCFYIKNTNALLTLLNSKIWISSNTPSTTTTMDIGLGSAAIGSTEQTIANETTAPTGVVFSSCASESLCLTIGSILNAQYKAVWVRRTVSAGGAAYTNDAATFTVKGESLA